MLGMPFYLHILYPYMIKFCTSQCILETIDSSVKCAKIEASLFPKFHPNTGLKFCAQTDEQSFFNQSSLIIHSSLLLEFKKQVYMPFEELFSFYLERSLVDVF